MARNRVVAVFALIAATIAMVDVAGAGGRPGVDPADRASAPFDYWTSERVAAAQPRDLLIDHRGLGYARRADGSLAPYGHGVAPATRPLHSLAVAGAQAGPAATDAATPMATVVGTMSPDGVTVGPSATFTAEVVSDFGVRSVNMYVGRPGSATQRFSMSYVGDDVWQSNLSGFSDGVWEWHIEARDQGPRGGATVTSDAVQFTVASGGGGSIVTDGRWTDGGQVQTAAGRILFTMPDGDYVCSGTAITDGTTGRSVVLTAAHCVYDDVAKVFSSNALFIPSQDDGGSDSTDFDCANDPIGCWSVDHGVVDVNWTTRSFPDNIAWDYGYYVVSDAGAHQGTTSDEVLDRAAGTLQADFTTPTLGELTTALGYSYTHDPDFRYCQEGMSASGSANYWLASCDLSGGASGGPWLQPLADGDGPVISVNSWGYTTRAGMAGPKLHDNSAQLLFTVAKGTDLSTADRGFVVDPTSPSTTTSTTTTVAPGPITLSVYAYKLRGEKIGELTWGSAEGDEVEVWRDRLPVQDLESNANDGFEIDSTGEKGGGTTTWQVCEAGNSAACSPEVTISW